MQVAKPFPVAVVTISEASPDAIAQLLEGDTHAVDLPSLNFDHAVFDRAAGSAAVFECRQQRCEAGVAQLQAADRDDLLPAFAVFDLQAGGLFGRRDFDDGGRRAGAFGFERAASLAVGRAVELSAFKQSHQRVLEGFRNCMTFLKGSGLGVAMLTGAFHHRGSGSTAARLLRDVNF